MRAMIALLLVGCGGAALPDPANEPHGPPHELGAECVTSTDCVGSYGQGRCIVKDTTATCYAAIYEGGDTLLYCDKLSNGLPESCCKSTNLNGSPYSLVAGDDLAGQPCYLGVMAPWM